MNLSRLRKQVKGEKLARRILGVDENASPQELKRAWRARARDLHPDTNDDDSEAARRFKIARLAYRCLQGNGDCVRLLEMEGTEKAVTGEEDEAENQWSYYLDWKERFF